MEFEKQRDEEVLEGKRNRKKSNYRKINNETRQKLIEMDFLLKDAAKILNINYSTAKTILRIFRIEKRVEKKNADEERELKSLLYTYKNDEEIKNNSRMFNKNLNIYGNQTNQYFANANTTTSSLTPTSSNIYSNKNFELINHEKGSNGFTNFKILIKEDENQLKEISSNRKNCHQNQNLEQYAEKTLTQSSLNLELSQHSLNHQNMPDVGNIKTMKEINEQMQIFTHQFQKLTGTVDNCFKNIKLNQQMINTLLQTSSKLHLDVINITNKNFGEINYMNNKSQNYNPQQENNYCVQNNYENNQQKTDSYSYGSRCNVNMLHNLYKNQN